MVPLSMQYILGGAWDVPSYQLTFQCTWFDALVAGAPPPRAILFFLCGPSLALALNTGGKSMPLQDNKQHPESPIVNQTLGGGQQSRKGQVHAPNSIGQLQTFHVWVHALRYCAASCSIFGRRGDPLLRANFHMFQYRCRAFLPKHDNDRLIGQLLVCCLPKHRAKLVFTSTLLTANFDVGDTMVDTDK